MIELEEVKNERVEEVKKVLKKKVKKPVKKVLKEGEKKKKGKKPGLLGKRNNPNIELYAFKAGNEIACKFSDDFIDAFASILLPTKEITMVSRKNEDGTYSDVQTIVEKNQWNAIVLSIQEMVELTNIRLRELKKDDKCITLATFYNYRNFYRSQMDGSEYNGPKYGAIDIRKFARLFDIYGKFLTKNKQDLFNNLGNDSKAWQRWAWMLERKFDEWNIREKKEVDITSKGESLSNVMKDISSFKPSLVYEATDTQKS